MDNTAITTRIFKGYSWVTKTAIKIKFKKKIKKTTTHLVIKVTVNYYIKNTKCCYRIAYCYFNYELGDFFVYFFM